MDLSRLKVFYIIAKTGSFTKAADELHISQSAVSRSLQLFEHRIKCKLINRTPRSLTLTPEGEQLYEFAKRFMDEADIVVNLIHDKDEEPQGELRIISTPYLASTWIPNYFADFFAKYPRITPMLIGTLEEINLSQADIAIRTFMPHQPHLIQKRFLDFHNKLWASPSYLKKYGIPQTSEELDHHKLISFGDKAYETYGSAHWILNVGAHAKPRKASIISNSVDGLINLANKGLGIIETPEEFLDVNSHNLVKVLPDLESPVIETYYIYSKLMDKSKKIRAFEKYIQEYVINVQKGNN